jgi:tripeptidyl-peptidase-2
MVLTNISSQRIATNRQFLLIIGATGRTLKLPGDLPADGKYRVGFKRAFAIYPRSLRDRVVKERLEKVWEPALGRHRADAAKKQQVENAKSNDASSSEAADLRMAKMRKENGDAELDALSTIDKKFRDSNGNGPGGDPGPVYDVVMHHTGDHWLVLIDTSESGRLEDAVRLRPFREFGDVAHLTAQDRLNVTVNVYEDGDIVEIVSACSSHGTHVASIAAAHFPDAPQKNGLAPGAQVVSISIGDSRLHSMETGTAIARACMHLMKAEHYKVIFHSHYFL